MASNVSGRIRRARQEDVSLVGVSTTAPGIAVPLHCIQDSLKAERGRGRRSLIVSVGLEHQRCVPSTDSRVGTLDLDRLKHTINKDRIEERGQGAPLRHTAVHRDEDRQRPRDTWAEHRL
jgi:hypothetical protein